MKASPGFLGVNLKTSNSQNICLPPKSVCIVAVLKYFDIGISSDQRNSIPLKRSIQTEYGDKQIFAGVEPTFLK